MNMVKHLLCSRKATTGGPCLLVCRHAVVTGLASHVELAVGSVPASVHTLLVLHVLCAQMVE